MPTTKYSHTFGLKDLLLIMTSTSKPTKKRTMSISSTLRVSVVSCVESSQRVEKEFHRSMARMKMTWGLGFSGFWREKGVGLGFRGEVMTCTYLKDETSCEGDEQRTPAPESVYVNMTSMTCQYVTNLTFTRRIPRNNDMTYINDMSHGSVTS